MTKHTDEYSWPPWNEYWSKERKKFAPFSALYSTSIRRSENSWNEVRTLGPEDPLWTEDPYRLGHSTPPSNRVTHEVKKIIDRTDSTLFDGAHFLSLRVIEELFQQNGMPTENIFLKTFFLKNSRGRDR
jgi:hypothetical protein